MTQDDLDAVIEMMETEADTAEDMWLRANPAPVGGRAALGTLAGLGIATLVGAAWARIERDTWFVNRIGERDVRMKLAGGQLFLAPIGAASLARPGTRLAAGIGAAVGVVAGQMPLLLDPMLVQRFPILGNLWQYTVPIGATLLAINAVTR